MCVLYFLSRKSVLPVTKKERKGEVKWSIGPKMKAGRTNMFKHGKDTSEVGKLIYRIDRLICVTSRSIIKVTHFLFTLSKVSLFETANERGAYGFF